MNAKPRPAPPFRIRPIVVAADEPIDVIPARHGLEVLVFPPASGVCARCRRRADRLTRDERTCPSCSGAP